MYVFDILYLDESINIKSLALLYIYCIVYNDPHRLLKLNVLFPFILKPLKNIFFQKSLLNSSVWILILF